MQILKSLFLSLVLVMISSLAFAYKDLRSNYDARFLDRMIHHHEVGINLAKLAQEKSTNQDVVKLSKKMEDEQMKEVEKMKQWRKDLFTDVPMKKEDYQVKMSELQNLTGKDFDQNYLTMMSKHHQTGIEMLEKAEAKLKNDKIRNFVKESAKKQAQEKQDIDHTNSSI